MSKYKALIGLEMHCEISRTNTKAFSSAKNGFTEDANTFVRPVDMGFPGALPVVNKEAVKKALMASIILGCKQPEYIYFERKNYYYPDLPKGYQITQETKPAPVGIYGEISYECNGEIKKAKINNIHLEEDSASLEHFSSFSLIDYNRAGVPLLELVTEPCFHTSDEAVAFLETMRSIYQYADISEADSKKGQIRCDVNISIMDDGLEEIPENYGTKVEIKNVNSFKNVKDAIEYEIKRQIEMKENGTYGELEQQTRRFDELSGTTKFMRSKVDAIDYKYFIEPNIPKFRLTKEWLREIAALIPPLAHDRKRKYTEEYGLKEYDASVIVKDKKVSDYYESIVSDGANPIEAANYLNTIILGAINKLDVEIDDFFIKPQDLSSLIKMSEEGKISKNQVKNTIYEAVDKGISPLEIVKNSNMEQISDDKELLNMVKTVLDNNPSQVDDYLNKGLTNIINYLLGQVMKQTQGKANPARTMELLKSEIEKLR